MHGFIRVSPYLVRNLKPHTFMLYYTIEHFNITKAFCFASAATLMGLAGIRDPRTYRKALKTLLDRGLIVRHNGRKRGRGCYTYQSLFSQPNDAFPVLKSYLFNPTIRPTHKVINIARHIYPKATSLELSRWLKISVSTIKHSPRVSTDLVRPVFEAKTAVQITPKAGCKICTISNIPELKKKETTEQYINLLGEQTSAPQNTNPVVIHELELEKEKAQIAHEEALKQDAIKQISLDLFNARAGEAETLFQDLRRLFPTVANKPIWQAIWQALQNEKKIKGTLLAYAIGIIRPFIKTFPDKSIIPTIKDTDIILRAKKQNKANELAAALQQKERELSALEEENKIANNRQFYAQLSDNSKAQLAAHIKHFGNPFQLPFLSEDMILLNACSRPDFIQECLSVLSENIEKPDVKHYKRGPVDMETAFTTRNIMPVEAEECLSRNSADIELQMMGCRVVIKGALCNTKHGHGYNNNAEEAKHFNWYSYVTFKEAF